MTLVHITYPPLVFSKCFRVTLNDLFIQHFETGQHFLPNTIVSVLNQAFLLSIADDSEKSNSVCQAMLATFAKAYLPKT